MMKHVALLLSIEIQISCLIPFHIHQVALLMENVICYFPPYEAEQRFSFFLRSHYMKQHQPEVKSRSCRRLPSSMRSEKAALPEIEIFSRANVKAAKKKPPSNANQLYHINLWRQYISVPFKFISRLGKCVQLRSSHILQPQYASTEKLKMYSIDVGVRHNARAYQWNLNA